MITNKKIKTAPESIHYLNEVVLGMSSSNGVIAKDYTSALPVQERLDDLEEKSNDTLADISALNEAVEELSNDTLADISALNEAVEELFIATEDTGWQPLEMTNASVSTEPHRTSMFIRKIGNVVSIIGKFEFISTYIQYPPDGYLAQLPPEYRPFGEVQVAVTANKQGTESGAQLEINNQQGYITLTSGHTANTIIFVRSLVYLTK